MRTYFRKLFSTLTAALVLALTLGTTAMASSTNGFFDFESQLFTIPQGSSAITSFKLVDDQKISGIYTINNTDGDTGCYILDYQDQHYTITLNIGPTEQGGTVTFLFYLDGHPGQYDKIDVHVTPGSKNNQVVRRGIDPVIPNAYDGSYAGFQNHTANLIRTAPANGIVDINTNTWVSFSKVVLDAWAARPDVTVNVAYRYQNENRTMTIPAGTDVSNMRTANGYVGFNYLYGPFQTTAAN